MSRTRLAFLALVGAVACGSAPVASTTTAVPLVVTPGRATPDSSAGALIPAGYGSLKQDEISIILQPNNVRVTAIPLDEGVIRVLAPDSYRALRAIAEPKRAQIQQRASMRGVREPHVWLATFTGLVPDARFVPTDFTVTSGGRDYRPFDVIGITTGFAEQRVQPREIQRGLLLFDEQIDVSQPMTVSMETEHNSDWAVILQKIDAERSAVRSRAAGKP